MDKETLESLLHFDPVTILIVVAGVIVIWTRLKDSVKWHSDWIRKHDTLCTEHKKDLNKVLTKVESNQTRLITLAEGHSERIDRLEIWRDKN